MSRGGRGGGRGGLKGATWDTTNDYKTPINCAPQENYPQHPRLKRPNPFNDTEKRQFKHYKTLQVQIHRGPLYTQSTQRNAENPPKTFNEDQFNRQYGTDPKADMDPFTAVDTYSMRFLPKKNVIPKLSGRPFCKELFPKELWPTLEGEDGKKVRKSINGAMERHSRLYSERGKDAESRKAALDKIFEQGEAEEEEEEAADEDEEQDDDFSDQDDDMAGDYNGEQYFDNGEGADDGDGEDDGNGGGDY